MNIFIYIYIIHLSDPYFWMRRHPTICGGLVLSVVPLQEFPFGLDLGRESGVQQFDFRIRVNLE